MRVTDGQKGQFGRFGRKDAVFLFLIAAVLLTIVMVSGPETTRKVPRSASHREVYVAVGTAAKHELDKTCGRCHGTAEAPLPATHPAGTRCLICHRLEKAAP